MINIWLVLNIFCPNTLNIWVSTHYLWFSCQIELYLFVPLANHYQLIKYVFVLLFFFSSNDKNLCSKAHLSGVRALCKSDLEAEVKKARRGRSILQNFQPPVLPQICPEVSTPVLGTSCTTVQSHSQERDGPFVVVPDEGDSRINCSSCKNQTELSMFHHCGVAIAFMYLACPPTHFLFPVFFSPSLLVSHYWFE